MSSIGLKFGVLIQVCDASRILTWEQIFFGVLYAILAFKQQQNILKQLELEILLYLSGQRQIKVAIEKFGMKSGDNIVIILGNSEETVKQSLVECERILGGVEADELITNFDRSKFLDIQKYFQISDEELNAIKFSDSKESNENALIKAILNRMALVTLEK